MREFPGIGGKFLNIHNMSSEIQLGGRIIPNFRIL